MKKYMLYIGVVAFLLIIGEYIRLRYSYTSFRNIHLTYISSLPIKKEILKIYNYLKANDCIGKFGYFKSQYRFNQKRQVELLSTLYNENFFNTSVINKSGNENFSHHEYIDCLQTLIILNTLLDSYGSLEISDRSNADKFQHMLYQITVWTLKFPQGEFIGRENILKNLCSENFKYLYKK